jgi:hypothetical protein
VPEVEFVNLFPVAAIAVADLAAVLLLSLLFSTVEGSTGSRVVLLAMFVAMVAVTAVAVSLAARSRRLGETLVRLQDTTAEIRVLLFPAGTLALLRSGRPRNRPKTGSKVHSARPPRTVYSPA